MSNNQKEQNDNTDKNTKDEENLDSDLNKKQAEQCLNIIKDKHNLAIGYFKYTYWIIIACISIIILMVILIGLDILEYDSYVINIFLGTTSVNIIWVRIYCYALVISKFTKNMIKQIFCESLPLL